MSPKPEENNPTATEPGTTAPGNTNQDTQVKPNTDQTATGTQTSTNNQNTQQGNTEQNNQNAEQGNTDDTDKDAKVNTNDDETKTDVKNDTELPETGLSNEYDYTTTVFGSIALISSLLLLRRQRKESK